jgi:hypothetical protein
MKLHTKLHTVVGWAKLRQVLNGTKDAALYLKSHGYDVAAARIILCL